MCARTCSTRAHPLVDGVEVPCPARQRAAVGRCAIRHDHLEGCPGARRELHGGVRDGADGCVGVPRRAGRASRRPTTLSPLMSCTRRSVSTTASPSVPIRHLPPEVSVGPKVAPEICPRAGPSSLTSGPGSTSSPRHRPAATAGPISRAAHSPAARHVGQLHGRIAGRSAGRAARRRPIGGKRLVRERREWPAIKPLTNIKPLSTRGRDYRPWRMRTRAQQT